MPERRLRVAILARSVHPLHGVGGLERHVYDLVRHLIAQDAHVTLITKPPTPSSRERSVEPSRAIDIASDRDTPDRDSPDRDAPGRSAGDRGAADWFGVPRDAFRLLTVPYVTFPGAGRRGTTVVDRATAYPLFGWRAGRVAAELARRGEVDIVHALGASGLGYARARGRPASSADHHRDHHRERDPRATHPRAGVAGLERVPFVFNPQGLEEFGATDPRRARLKRAAYAPLQMAVRACARAADVVLATDRALVPTVLRHLPVDASRVAVMPNAIDLATLDRRRDPAAGAALRARLGLDADTPVLLSVGRLEENKGFHVAARALGALLRRHGGARDPGPRDWRWVLIGEGPYRSSIERVAAEEGPGSRMIVAGRASDADLHAWYETATLFVHPTLYEGSSLVTLEAMAHERAVVATRAGGLPDKVFPGVNGWLVEPDRADRLADALAEAMHAMSAEPAAAEAWAAGASTTAASAAGAHAPSDAGSTGASRGETVLARMGRAGRAIVERDFAWPAVAARLMALYRQIGSSG